MLSCSTYESAAPVRRWHAAGEDKVLPHSILYKEWIYFLLPHIEII
jgi:hypothetical protein